MDLEKIKQNRTKVILQFAVPSIIAMILTSMINIIDGLFIGNYIGSNGLAAVNLGLPIIYLFLAVGLMIGVGGISIAGRLLGASEIKHSNQVFRQTVALCIIVSAALTLIMFFLLEPISRFFSTDAVTRKYFMQYYRILIFELPLIIITSTIGMFIRGEGNPAFVMVTNVIGVILNTIFNYIFVKSLSLGTAGIAWASLLSAIIVLFVNILYIVGPAKIYKFGQYRFDKKEIKDTLLNGCSEFIGELSMCLSMAAYNYVILKNAGVDGLSAFTIIGYVSYVFSMINVGFGQGIVPIISFSYGAMKHDLARLVRNTTMKMISIIAVVIFIVMSISAKSYCELFSKKAEVTKFVIFGLKIQMTSFLFAGINTIASFFFTAIGKAKESGVISASRGLFILMISIMVLPTLFGITGVWFVSLTTETITIIFSIIYMHQNKIADLK